MTTEGKRSGPRLQDLCSRIALCAGHVHCFGEGSPQATRLALGNARQILADAGELVAMVEQRYEAIKDHPVGEPSVQ